MSSWSISLFSAMVAVCMSFALALCICWKKKSHKNDMLGLHGMVTQKNPDENVNHLPSASPPCIVEVGDQTDAAKRNAPTTNTKRSLPDIPSEQEVAVNWEPTGDNSSEHYATLGQYRNAKRNTMANGVEARPSISQHSSMSQADDGFSPYEKVKYDKIKLKEHSYAQLQPTTSRQVIQEEMGLLEERNNFLRPEMSGEPAPPSRSRRSSASSLLGVDIPAASAVAGGIAASPDLPYMTPPVHQTQANFSGDSQDSSKGYTSISVREPLANIIAQTKKMAKNRNLDPHYSTVSDDSDDVYTTIPDPNQIYTSESETYAQIPAHPNPITVEAEVNPIPSGINNRTNNAINAENDDELYEPPPQPPLPPLTNKQPPTHSRQASSSSSIANVGSPKPEKRQANSPLPPPPNSGPIFDLHPPLPRNLDDLYAKVHKTKKDDAHSTNDPSDTTNSDRSPEKLTRRKSTSSTNSDGKNATREHNYETLAGCGGPESLSSSDPGYEVLKKRPDPNYEELRAKNEAMDGYSVIKKMAKDGGKASSYDASSSDEPNYESMPNYDNSKSAPSESEPNYESLEPAYERLKNDSDSVGYERVGSRIGYENIDSSNSSENNRAGYEQLSNDTDCDLSLNDGGSSAKESLTKNTSNNIRKSLGEAGSSNSLNDPNYSTISIKKDCGLLEEDGIVQV